MLYGQSQSPSNDLFELSLFGISPIRSILLQEIARYDAEFGDYNLFHSVRLAIHYASDEMVRLYVPPSPARQEYDPNRKYISLLSLKKLSSTASKMNLEHIAGLQRAFMTSGALEFCCRDHNCLGSITIGRIYGKTSRLL